MTAPSSSTPHASPASSPRNQRSWLLGGLVVLTCCIAIRFYTGMETVSAKSPLSLIKRPAAAAKPSTTGPVLPNAAGGATNAEPPKQNFVAVVNNEQISRDELARDCVLHYGNEVLESLVNKHLIAEFCQRQQITVSDREVEAEIDRMARKFSLAKDQWLKMLEKERGIKPKQYARDIIWPTLALRKLASAQLTVTPQELNEAFESQFGAAVKARLIVLDSPSEAQRVHAKAAAKPEEFGALARKESKDVSSASANGMIQPIRRHLGEKALEDTAFSLRKGQVFGVIKIGSQYVILKCEDHLPAAKADRARVTPLLEDAIRDRKLRSAASDLFSQLQKDAIVENILNDPERSKQLPGVAALLNGRRITIRELAEECFDRHSVKCLEGLIQHKMLEQALRKRNLTVTQDDLRAEVARAAATMGKTTQSGQPDIEGFLELVSKQQGVKKEVYIHDAVWPSVALKKMLDGQVQITEKDLQMGFEANYGPRVRCRAIVLTNQRKAQQVWEMARNNPSPENFGDLAEQYSVEASSRALRGEVPPVQKHGGQPLLEREAFSLQPGEISGVIQVGESFVILRCEGYTKPTQVAMSEVKGMILDDLREKKQRIAMNKRFEQLQESAQIDNYLAGTVKSPKNAAKDLVAREKAAGTMKR